MTVAPALPSMAKTVSAWKKVSFFTQRRSSAQADGSGDIHETQTPRTDGE